MEKIFVKDLVADTTIDTAFMIQAWSVRQKRNGEDFLTLVLKDKTGEINAVMWDNVEEGKAAAADGAYVWVTGRVGTFNDKKQLTVARVKRLSSDDVGEADFLAVTGNDIESLWQELREIADSIGHLHLRKLILDYIGDDELAEKLKRAPAAMNFHHTFIGGLLEHTLSMLTLADKIAGQYSLIDRDLLLTGVFLHDLAKVDELQYEREYSYSVEGKLLGHITMGILEAEKRMSALDFPEKLRLKVLHMILSHHGEEQFGSPKKPMLPEAIALHYIDMLDSRMEMAREALEQSASGEDVFTEWHRGLGTSLFKG